jgi:hypothetical protein
MPSALRWRGQIKNGMPAMNDAVAFRQHLATIGEGNDICVTVTRWRNTRTNAQNAYYWGVVVRYIAQHVGLTADECHEALREKFIPLSEGALPFRQSTTDFTTEEFEQYIAEVKNWSRAFLNVLIPEPNEGEAGQWK